MSLRFQLLLLSVLTLLLPWAGLRYAREVETVLREGEQQALLATANTLANVLATDGNLSTALQAAPVNFDPQAGDVYVHRLHSRPLLDGYADDWGIAEEAFHRIASSDNTVQVRYAAGTDEQNLYLLFVVKDRAVRLEQTTDASVPPEKRAVHLWWSLPAATDTSGLYLFATSAPGLIGARRPTHSDFGQRGERTEPRVQGWWQQDREGYRLEISVPLGLVGTRMGFETVDVGDLSQEPISAGTLDPQTHAPVAGRLLMPSVALERRVATLLPAGTRAMVTDTAGWIVAESGALSLAPVNAYSEPSDLLQALYRRLLESGREAPTVRASIPGHVDGAHIAAALKGRSGSTRFRLPDERRTVLSVAAPVNGAGTLVLEQTADRLLLLRDRALMRLMNLTLLVTGIAVLATFAFATRLGLRLTRLKRAAETALARDGRVNTVIPDIRSRDELGDVARSFEALLKRLDEYTEYLRTLAGKLSHELRTPLTIVRSSIENLESQPVAAESQAYLTRARAGTDRLQVILTAMGAATRTEEAIRSAERCRFNLSELVLSMTRAYGDAFPQRKFEARVSRPDCMLHGAPDLIVQLLDKLTDNAVDFSAPGSTVELELKETRLGEIELCVINEGPPIPPELHARLFESMFQVRDRSTGDARPETAHFGLGLYVVRLIAQFHEGEVIAENLAQRPAVRFGVRLPHARE